MSFRYTVSSIKVKSSWFDIVVRKKNTYQKITYKGLNLYFQLFKFRLHNQDDQYTFVTSISLLRKETNYTSDEIFGLLKKMKSAGVIKMENVSRWDYLLDDEGNPKDKDILIITAADLPNTRRQQRTNVDGKPMFKDKENKTPVMIDAPVSDGDYYIAVSFGMLDYYEKKKLNERYYALYCLISRWNKGHWDGKMNMKIEKIASCLDFDKDTIHRMIIEMNRQQVLASQRKIRKQGGYKYEHYLLNKSDGESIEAFVNRYGDVMEKVTIRADSRKKSKKQQNVEDLMPESHEIYEPDSPVRERKHAWGEPSPFANVSRKEIKDEEDMFAEFDDEFAELFG